MGSQYYILKQVLRTPEAVFDREKEAFLVFFASKSKQGVDEAKQRIYASYTKDFQNFSDAFLYMEREKDVIDTTIVEENGSYFRISKDETDSLLLLEKSDSLNGAFTLVPSKTFAELAGVEGPECFCCLMEKHGV